MAKKKTIYVVTSGMYSDYSIDAMFTTKEKAEEYIVLGEKYGKCTYDDTPFIEEWILDDPHLYINVDEVIVDIHGKVAASKRCSIDAYSEPTSFVTDAGFFVGRSRRGYEAAKKVAIELIHKTDPRRDEVL